MEHSSSDLSGFHNHSSKPVITASHSRRICRRSASLTGSETNPASPNFRKFGAKDSVVIESVAEVGSTPGVVATTFPFVSKVAITAKGELTDHHPKWRSKRMHSSLCISTKSSASLNQAAATRIAPPWERQRVRSSIPALLLPRLTQKVAPIVWTTPRCDCKHYKWQNFGMNFNDLANLCTAIRTSWKTQLKKVFPVLFGGEQPGTSKALGGPVTGNANWLIK